MAPKYQKGPDLKRFMVRRSKKNTIVTLFILLLLDHATTHGAQLSTRACVCALLFFVDLCDVFHQYADSTLARGKVNIMYHYHSPSPTT
mmetsp:Transcript_2313/g.3361  ORF Transcript_2313/g.3361 Transcript_2313/m.3361 type:complete len:89 (+) Transcript_2313:169-435(+)